MKIGGTGFDFPGFYVNIPPYIHFHSTCIQNDESFESVYFLSNVSRTGIPLFVKRVMARRKILRLENGKRAQARDMYGWGADQEGTSCFVYHRTDGPCDEYERQQHGQPLCPPNDDFHRFSKRSIGFCICRPEFRYFGVVPAILYLLLFR